MIKEAIFNNIILSSPERLSTKSLKWTRIAPFLKNHALGDRTGLEDIYVDNTRKPTRIREKKVKSPMVAHGNADPMHLHWTLESDQKPKTPPRLVWKLLALRTEGATVRVVVSLESYCRD